MNWIEKIQKAWENRDQIAEGFYNTYIGCTEDIQKETDRRLLICRSNECGMYDQFGRSDKAVMKGSESCGSCGCVLPLKAACQSCNCALLDEGKTPLWTATMSHEQEKELGDIHYKKQFENK